jgi:hypothetical protein
MYTAVRVLSSHDRPRVSDPGTVLQNDQEAGTRDWPLTLYPRTTLSMYVARHLHIQDLPLIPRLVGCCRVESPRRTPPAFDHDRNAATGFCLLFHLVRGQLDHKCVSGLYQCRKCDHHVQRER